MIHRTGRGRREMLPLQQSSPSPGRSAVLSVRGVGTLNFFFLAALVLLIILGLFALSGDRHLKTEPAVPAEVQGSYTLILYGCGSRDTIENVAILDREGDGYAFVLAAPDFSYTVKSGLSAEAALGEAEQFIRCNINVMRSQLRRVLGPSGAVVGFAVMPLYPVIQFGREDVIDVQYTVQDRTITVRISLDPAIERLRMG